MKKIFTLCAAFVAAISASADTESYKAVTYDGTTYIVSADFTGAVIQNGESHVKFSTANMEVEAVGGTTAKDVFQEVGTEFAGWTEWNDVKWDLKNEGSITYGYILGTGNPAMDFTAEEVLTEGERTGHYRPTYTYYTPDCGKMPVMGLYYKFKAKAAGELKVFVWSNKNNRNTYLVDEATTKPVTYKAEGYINGQDGEDGKKKWLSADEIQAIHTAAFEGKEDKPYVIAGGNQPYWGVIIYTMTEGQTVWLFQDSSQIGFQGYEFTPDGTSGISDIVVEKAQNDAIYNIAGQRVSGSAKGLVIKNGKKYFVK